MSDIKRSTGHSHSLPQSPRRPSVPCPFLPWPSPVALPVGGHLASSPLPSNSCAGERPRTAPVGPLMPCHCSIHPVPSSAAGSRSMSSGKAPAADHAHQPSSLSFSAHRRRGRSVFMNRHHRTTHSNSRIFSQKQRSHPGVGLQTILRRTRQSDLQFSVHIPYSAVSPSDGSDRIRPLWPATHSTASALRRQAPSSLPCRRARHWGPT